MGFIRGLICQNDADYRGKERALFNAIIKLNDNNGVPLCNSLFYSGAFGKADIYTIDDKPILVEPTQIEFQNEANKLPLNFQNLDSSIIKNEI